MNLRPTARLSISPTSLTFEIDENTKKSSNILRLHNPDSDSVIYFKIRTTGRIRYVVRPNHGAVPPNDVTTIDLVFTLPQEESLSAPIKDKFVIYSAVGPKFTRDRQTIENFLTENSKICEKTQIDAVAILPVNSSGVKKSFSFAHNHNYATYPLALSEPDFQRTPVRRDYLNHSENYESVLSHSNQASEISKEDNYLNVTAGMRRRPIDVKQSQVSNVTVKLPGSIGYGKPAQVSSMAKTLPPKSNFQKSNLFEAEFSNDLMFEKTNKLITPEESVHFETAMPSFTRSPQVQPTVKEPTPIRMEKRVASVPSEVTSSKYDFLQQGGYQLWQLMLVLIVGTIIGAYLNGRS